MPICPGLVPPGWIEAQGLIAFPDQPPLRETLWLLLPEGRVQRSATARHLTGSCGSGWGRRWKPGFRELPLSRKGLAARSRCPLAEVESKTMQLVHRIAAMEVAILRREAVNCCKTEQREALRHQTEGPLLRIAERRSLAYKHHHAGWLHQPLWGCPERDKGGSLPGALVGQP